MLRPGRVKNCKMRDEVLVIPIGDVEVGAQGQLVMPKEWCFDSFIFDGGSIRGGVVTRFGGVLDLPDEDSPF